MEKTGFTVFWAAAGYTDVYADGGQRFASKKEALDSIPSQAEELIYIYRNNEQQREVIYNGFFVIVDDNDVGVGRSVHPFSDFHQIAA